jgi:hypothetical protein
MRLAGYLVSSMVASSIPMDFYRLIGKPLNSEQMMSTVTAGIPERIGFRSCRDQLVFISISG